MGGINEKPEDAKSVTAGGTDADEVHRNMLKLLDEMTRNLKVDAEMYDIIARFVRTVNQLIDKAYRGDAEAFEQAKRLVRWMETNYHLVPHVLKQKVPRVYGADIPKTSEAWLVRMQPHRNWSRYKDIVITATVTWAVTEILTLSVLRAVHIL